MFSELNTPCILSQEPVYPADEGITYHPAMGAKDDDGPVSAGPLLRYLTNEGISQADFARKLNCSPQIITNWKARGIPRGELIKVSRAMRTTVEQYLTAAIDTSKLASIGARMRRAMAPGVTPLDVPIFDIEASAGRGRVVEAHEPVVGGLSLSREWVRSHLPSITGVGNLAVISAMGDSMSPTFADGDILLVDRGVVDVKIDAVFVVGRGDDLLVKRIQRRLSGDIVIRSDNPLFEPETVGGRDVENIRILGRVVWAWNGRRL